MTNSIIIGLNLEKNGRAKTAQKTRFRLSQNINVTKQTAIKIKNASPSSLNIQDKKHNAHITATAQGDSKKTLIF